MWYMVECEQEYEYLFYCTLPKTLIAGSTTTSVSAIGPTTLTQDKSQLKQGHKGSDAGQIVGILFGVGAVIGVVVGGVMYWRNSFRRVIRVPPVNELATAQAQMRDTVIAGRRGSDLQILTRANNDKQ